VGLHRFEQSGQLRFIVEAEQIVRKVARPAVTPTLVDEIARGTKNIAEMGWVTKIASVTKNAGVTEIRAILRYNSYRFEIHIFFSSAQVS
jgi:hypothetical protein